MADKSIPATALTRASSIPLPITDRRTSPRCAPSAMRNPNLMRALCHRVRHDAIYPYRRQHQRHGAENSKQNVYHIIAALLFVDQA